MACCGDARYHHPGEHVAASGVTVDYEMVAFAEEISELASELGRLVATGPGRGTTSLFADHGDEPLPQVDGHGVVVDGEGQALCVIRTTRVETARFGDVDAELAWVESGGDRSLERWRGTHLDFVAALGNLVDDNTRVVLERFEKAWPEAD